MKLTHIILTGTILLLLGCKDSRVPIESDAYRNFSDLYRIDNPSLPLFEDYRSLPISITNGDLLDHNSILFLAESANVTPIKRENLEALLPKEEFDHLISQNCKPRKDSLICSKEFFTYGRIIKPNYILLEYCIKKYGAWGRHYVFEYRTHKADGTLISKIEFAKWSEKDKEFFGGKLTPEMKIQISSKGEIIAQYSITDNGSIIQ